MPIAIAHGGLDGAPWHTLKREITAVIPSKIIRFLEERANIGFAGTRDANLVPSGHRLVRLADRPVGPDAHRLHAATPLRPGCSRR